MNAITFRPIASSTANLNFPLIASWKVLRVARTCSARPASLQQPIRHKGAARETTWHHCSRAIAAAASSKSSGS
jgi:hypothetical protein